MGVSGSGKSTIGPALAARLGARYIDGDDLHPAANIAKMRRGEALTDADRWPWLDRVGAALESATGPLIVGCSALRRAYRDRIAAAAGGCVSFAYLCISPVEATARLRARPNHFMPASLVESQFATLEPPASDEPVVTVDATLPPEAITAELAARLGA